jgi:hypothetical protein
LREYVRRWLGECLDLKEENNKEDEERVIMRKSILCFQQIGSERSGRGESGMHGT